MVCALQHVLLHLIVYQFVLSICSGVTIVALLHGLKKLNAGTLIIARRAPVVANELHG